VGGGVGGGDEGVVVVGLEVGGGVAESSGMAKSPASVQGVVIDANALRFTATSSVWIGLALFPQSLRM
jgi:hypothetical protein